MKEFLKRLKEKVDVGIVGGSDPVEAARAAGR